MQPVTYCLCGMIDIGHTRTFAAIEEDIEYIQVIPRDAPPPDSSAPYDEITHTIDGNIVRKKVDVLLARISTLKDAYKEQYGLDMPTIERDAVLKRIGLTKKVLQISGRNHAL